MIHNQKGQSVVEAVFMLVVLIGVVGLVAQGMRENRFVRNLVATPWIKLKGTIENGKFGDPNTTRVKHPSHLEMHISLAGKEE